MTTTHEAIVEAAPASSRIRAAAVALFATNGVAGTSLRAVAEHAGVSIGLVQHHFGTKDRLRTAVDDYVLATVADAIASQPLPWPPDDPLTELGHRVTSILRHDPAVVRYVGRALVDGEPVAFTVFDRLVDVTTAQWDQLAARGLLRGDVDRLWAILHSLIVVIGTTLLQAPIERHLPAPLLTEDQLRRWDRATAELLRRGLLRATTTEPLSATEAAIPLVFIREIDEMSFRFEPESHRVNDHYSYKRVDADVWCRWLPNHGWCTCDDDGNANGWPLAQTGADTTPPAGHWRSFKHGKSYLYRLHLPDGQLT